MARTPEETQEMIATSKAHLKQDREELNHLSQRSWDNVCELYRRLDLIDGANPSAENLGHIKVVETILTQTRERCREMRGMQRQIDKRADEHSRGVFR